LWKMLLLEPLATISTIAIAKNNAWGIKLLKERHAIGYLICRSHVAMQGDARVHRPTIWCLIRVHDGVLGCGHMVGGYPIHGIEGCSCCQWPL
jgi:hypothetical protein